MCSCVCQCSHHENLYNCCVCLSNWTLAFVDSSHYNPATAFLSPPHACMNLFSELENRLPFLCWSYLLLTGYFLHVSPRLDSLRPMSIILMLTAHPRSLSSWVPASLWHRFWYSTSNPMCKCPLTLLGLWPLWLGHTSREVFSLTHWGPGPYPTWEATLWRFFSSSEVGW